jgi:UDP-N-acetylglucosamine acyltransferase
VRLNIQRAYKILYRSGRTPAAALEQIRSEVEPSPEIERLSEFIASSKRGIC